MVDADSSESGLPNENSSRAKCTSAVRSIQD